MLKIKLARFGKRKQPHFRIVINEARDKRDGSYVEMIGHYGPTQDPKLLELDLKKYEAWLVKGAQPTETVAFLYEVVKAGKGFPVKKKKPSKKKLSKESATKEEKKEQPETKKEEAPKKEEKKAVKPAVKEVVKEVAKEVDKEVVKEKKVEEVQVSKEATEKK
jgi:small subunit ribosomal protein S16